LNELVFDVHQDYLIVFFYYPNNDNDVSVDDESKMNSESICFRKKQLLEYLQYFL
jgi:hypothetical protein